MNTLLGNNSLEYLAGSETWTEALALALHADGHAVCCYGRTLGVIADRLSAAGIRCADDVDALADFEPELIIAAHWPVVEALGSAFVDVPLISVIHGVTHHHHDGSRALEHPSIKGRVSAFVSVSGEVRDKLRRDYGLPSHVIENGILLERFRAEPVSPAPGRFLFSANGVPSDAPEFEVLQATASYFGAELVGMGSLFEASPRPWQLIREADVVFGMGRSVLEGLAMGRLGVVHGCWGTGGVVHAGNVDALRYYNYSGRNSDGACWQSTRLIESIERYYASPVLEWGPLHVGDHHDAVQMARAFVDLGSSLVS